MSEALALSEVDALYGESHVLHEVSFALEAGQVLALLGRNGAGKTTCMSSDHRLPAAARAARSACSASRSRASRPRRSRARAIGFVPQGRRDLPRRSRSAKISSSRAGPGAGAPVPWTLERVVDLFPRLKERLQQVAGSLSGGEQQMLAIGRALMGNPRVLLMDEPSEGLAPLIVAEVGRTIARLKEEGQSILLVEQNVKLALDLADDVVILNTGRVAFRGRRGRVRADQALITQHLGVF